jgi:CHASE2 domain-containing sensor protein
MNKRTLFIWRDAILTLLVLLMLKSLASFIGHFIEHIDLHGLDPGKAAVKNLELLDLHYAYRAEHEEQAENIVLVNTGSLNHAEPDSFRLAYINVLDALQTAKAIAIGVDIEFDITNNGNVDGLLVDSADNCPTCVFATSADSLKLKMGTTRGFTEFPVDSMQCVRHIQLASDKKKGESTSFSAQIARFVNPSIELSDFTSGDTNAMYIDFVHHPNRFRHPLDEHFRNDAVFNHFDAIEARDLLDRASLAALMPYLEGKVIMLGHLGNTAYQKERYHDHNVYAVGNTYDLEDMHVAPHGHADLVQRRANAHGLTIHAEAVHNLLYSNRHLKKPAGWIEYGLISLWLLLVTVYYMWLKNFGDAYKVFAILSAPVITIVATYLVLGARSDGHYINIGLMNVTTFLLVEVVEFYGKIAYRLKKKWNFKSYYCYSHASH